MKFFMSGEVDGKVSDVYRLIINDIEKQITTLMQNDYGAEITGISVIPIIVTSTMLEAGFFKERKLLRKGDSDYRLQIDYDKFFDADVETKRLLIIKNIIESIRDIGRRAKNDFRATKLEEDILNILGVTVEEIDHLV